MLVCAKRLWVFLFIDYAVFYIKKDSRLLSKISKIAKFGLSIFRHSFIRFFKYIFRERAIELGEKMVCLNQLIRLLKHVAVIIWTRLKPTVVASANTVYCLTLSDVISITSTQSGWYFNAVISITSTRIKRAHRQSVGRKFYNKIDSNLVYCSDFRYESNGIFVLGVGFFFFRQISTF